jgi:hypothetical protein
MGYYSKKAMFVALDSPTVKAYMDLADGAH